MQRQLPRPLCEVWPSVSAPLRPGPSDLGFFQQTLADWQGEHPNAPAPRALILGATAELWSLPWPDPSQVTVFEPDSETAEQLWPGPRDQVQQRSWLTLGPADGPFDLVLCDAGLHTLGYPQAQSELVRRLFEVMPNGGLAAFRLLSPPTQHESTVRVVSELWAGRITDISQLLLRLSLSMQRSAATGVRMSAVWLKLRSLSKDLPTLAERLGWPLSHLQAADIYRFSPAHHHFVTLVETLQVFAQGDRKLFDMVRMNTGDSPMAAQCPTIVFRRN